MKPSRHRFLASLFAIALGLLQGTTAIAAPERSARVAVVIGNSAYKSGALANPVNDATAMAAALKRLDFDVELKLNATRADFNEVFKRFAAKAEKAQVATIFYAGHGIQVGGANYIVPVDANPQSERDLKRELVKMDDLIDDMGDARVKLIFFDACRDNPLSRSFSRGGTRGMAAPIEATGTLISFATKHGNTALDGTGRHSPYTQSLLAALENPAGVEIEQMLRRVQQGVRQATNGQQEPWRYGSLDGEFFFRPAVTVDTARIQQEAVDRAVQEATRRATEQAARERAEMQAALKEQQEAAQRLAQKAAEQAAQEAVRRANEQVARERAEMQASMEKLLKEALAKQSIALEAERAARAAAPTSVATTSSIPGASSAPMKLATLAPGPAAPAPGLAAQTSTLSRTPGETWEYKVIDRQYGKEHKLSLRTKAATATGLLEEVSLDGRGLDWVFGTKAAAIGLATESHFMLAPNWDGKDMPSSFPVEGGTGPCTGEWVCRISLRLVGTERITIAAGTFDALRFDGEFTFEPSTPQPANWAGQKLAKVSVWYSRENRRLLRQTAKHAGSGMNSRSSFDEAIELAVASEAALVAEPGSAPVQLASRSPAINVASPAAAAPGDEWEYQVADHRFGKRQKLLLRVRQISSSGSQIDAFLDAKPIGAWFFNQETVAIATPSESGFLFGPYWNGQNLTEIEVRGGSGTCLQTSRCRLSLSGVATESVDVPAGKFETIRLEGKLVIDNGPSNNGQIGGIHVARVTVWYAREQGRLVKQTAKLVSNQFMSFDEAIELAAIRRAAR